MASAKLPTPDELKAVGRQLGMTLSDADVAFFLETMGGSVAAYHAVEAMADPMPPVKYPRTPGYRPEGAENKYNAWYYKSEVQGAGSATSLPALRRLLQPCRSTRVVRIGPIGWQRPSCSRSSHFAVRVCSLRSTGCGPSWASCCSRS